ncbi:indolepyruvate oxidoreductase subunit beta [Orenia marismortui]|uniref:indolepyruvate oxidoreductase subunit beta n=1 Tax=Orenia marismortui TaxID=46469 RepID=UPI000371AA30|nr:indolepyruvate oxidoreductase subunit beta [Orenia marismortui]
MNIVIAAVGGQGALLASKIIGRLAQNTGKDVKVSEIHGMSQRGGSVVSYVKFDDKVYSPIVEKGTADIVLAFEMLEGARYASYLKAGGTLIVNTQKIDPMPVITGQKDYPKDLITKLESSNINLISVDALNMAISVNNIKTVNVVLIGIMAQQTKISKKEWLEAITEIVPQKFLTVNLRAFELGYNLA